MLVAFENEGDYKRGDEALNAMPAGDTPGKRSSCEIPGRVAWQSAFGYSGSQPSRYWDGARVGNRAYAWSASVVSCTTPAPWRSAASSTV